MAAELEIVQDLFNTLGIHGTFTYPVNIVEFAAGAHGLRDLGPAPNAEPRHIMQCIDKMRQGLGSPYFRQLFDTPADVDDMWVHYWCPQPKGTDLAKTQCPAGTHPLWTNGQQTVFVRIVTDKHGNELCDFGVV
jgi:hypothetical protein